MTKILFTGATGVLGRATVPLLVAAGHDVTGVARNDAGVAWLDEAGARPLRLDLFQPGAVADAMAGIDVVIHYATSIPTQSKMSKRASWEANDRLRSVATGVLVDAAMEAGVTRFVQQSVTMLYADGGGDWLGEDAEVAPAWEVLDSALAAEHHVTRFRDGGGTGVVLRLSRLYGPGRASAEYAEAVAQRKLPIVGHGRNYVSSIHVDDAASALLAVLAAPGGVYNVTDDEPLTATEYTETVARLLEAPAPRHLPAWLGRVALGKASGLLTTSHRVSNRHIRQTTGWAPVYPSAREGWRHIVTSNR